MLHAQKYDGLKKKKLKGYHIHSMYRCLLQLSCEEESIILTWAEWQNKIKRVRRPFNHEGGGGTASKMSPLHLGSVLSGEGLHSLQKVQGQAVLSVVLREDFNETADQPAGLWQGNQGAPQLAGVLQHT